MALLKLLAQLGLDKTGFDAGMAAATKSTEKFGRQLVNKLGAGFGVAAITAFAREVIQAGKEIDALADKLGITKEAAQKVRLREMLGGETGKGLALMSDQDLENLRVADRMMIKLRETAKTLFAKAAFTVAGANNPIASMIQGVVALGKKTGFVSAEPPTVQQDAIQREAHMATQDRILQLEKEAAQLNARAMDARLTDEERLNKLLKERAQIEGMLKGDVFVSDEAEAMTRKRLAELNLGIAQAEERRDSRKGGDIPSKGSLPGVFSGASGALSSIPREIMKTNEALSKIHRLLDSKGIFVKGERR